MKIDLHCVSAEVRALIPNAPNFPPYVVVRLKAVGKDGALVNQPWLRMTPDTARDLAMALAVAMRDLSNAPGQPDMH